MCQFDPKNDSRWIDPCMVNLIGFLKERGIETVACCCGHGIYPMTILVRTGEPGVTREICHNITFHGRKKRFYRKDEDGVYYIPEVQRMMQWAMTTHSNAEVCQQSKRSMAWEGIEESKWIRGLATKGQDSGIYFR